MFLFVMFSSAWSNQFISTAAVES